MFLLTRLARALQDACHFSKEPINDPRAPLFLAFTSYSYTGTHGHPSLSLSQDLQLDARDKRDREEPQRSSEGDPGTKGGAPRNYSSVRRLRSHQAAPPRGACS